MKNRECLSREDMAKFILNLGLETKEKDDMIDHFHNCKKCMMIVNAVSEVLETIEEEEETK